MLVDFSIPISIWKLRMHVLAVGARLKKIKKGKYFATHIVLASQKPIREMSNTPKSKKRAAEARKKFNLFPRSKMIPVSITPASRMNPNTMSFVVNIAKTLCLASTTLASRIIRRTHNFLIQIAKKL